MQYSQTNIQALYYWSVSEMIHSRFTNMLSFYATPKTKNTANCGKHILWLKINEISKNLPAESDILSSEEKES